MKALAIIIIALSSFFTYGQSTGDCQRILLEVLNKKKKEKVAEHLILSEDQSKLFWPLYEEFVVKLGEIEEQRIDLLTEFGNSDEELTEEDAENVWKRYKTYETDRHDLFIEYYPKFKKAVGAVNTVTYYQIEIKVETLVRSKASEELPLLNASA